MSQSLRLIVLLVLCCRIVIIACNSCAQAGRTRPHKWPQGQQARPGRQMTVMLIDEGVSTDSLLILCHIYWQLHGNPRKASDSVAVATLNIRPPGGRQCPVSNTVTPAPTRRGPCTNVRKARTPRGAQDYHGTRRPRAARDSSTSWRQGMRSARARGTRQPVNLSTSLGARARGIRPRSGAWVPSAARGANCYATRRAAWC